MITGRHLEKRTRRMPWFEQAVYVTPANRALAELRSIPRIRDHLYCIHDLNGHRWYADEVRHNVSPGGLAVIRTIGDPDDDLAENDLSWNDVPSIDSPNLEISPEIPHVVNCMGEALCPSPPVRFLRYLKHVSVDYDATVVLYSGASWGGPIEYEFAWVFQPDEFVYCLDDPSNGYRLYGSDGNMRHHKGNIRREVMHHLGIELPALYCAFFDSAFEWHRFKVTPDVR